MHDREAVVDEIYQSGQSPNMFSGIHGTSMYNQGSSFMSVGGNVNHIYNDVPGHKLPHVNVAPSNPYELPSQRYSRLLMPAGRGYPLLDAKLPLELPEEYQLRGVMIGDVGIVTEDGYFDVLFNICEPADGPINGGTVPEGFKKLERPKNERHNYRAGTSYGPGEKVVGGDVYCTFGTGGAQPGAYRFQCGPREGAILALPSGASKNDLKNHREFLEYARSHGVSWYEFANDRLGRNITNGSMYLITGYDKAGRWGTASISHSSAIPKFEMRFTNAAWDEPSPGPAVVKQGQNSQGDDWPENQCIFLRGYKVTLSTRILDKLFGICVAETSPMDKLAQEPARWNFMIFRVIDGIFAAVSVWNTGGSAPGSEYRDQESNADQLEADVTPTVPALSMGIHPSSLINLYLLNKFPESDLAITHDSVWCSYIRERREGGNQNQNFCAEYINAKYVIKHEDGAVYLEATPADPSSSGANVPCQDSVATSHSSSEQDARPTNQFPAEIWLKILSFSEVAERWKLYPVNKTVYEICMTEKYRSIAFRTHKDITRSLDLVSTPSIACRVRQIEYWPKALSGTSRPQQGLQSAQGANMGGADSDRVQDLVGLMGRLTNVQAFTLHSNRAQELPAFLTALPTLTAGWNAFGNNLRKLGLYVTMEAYEKALTPELFFPQLEDLSLKFTKAPDGTDSDYILSTAVAPFANKHNSTLRTLKLSTQGHIDISSFLTSLGQFTRLTDLSYVCFLVEERELDAIRHVLITNASTLENLSMQFLNLHPGRVTQEGLELKSWFTPETLQVELPQLESLDFTTDFEQEIPQIVEFLQVYAGTLKSLSLGYQKFSLHEMSCIAEVFSGSKTLKKLHCGVTHLVPALFTTLASHIPGLESLDLRMDYVGVDESEGAHNYKQFEHKMSGIVCSGWSLNRFHGFITTGPVTGMGQADMERTLRGSIPNLQALELTLRPGV